MVKAQKRVFSHFVSYTYGRPKVMASYEASLLYGRVETLLPLSCQKIPNNEPSCTSEMSNYFVQKRSYDPNHPHQREHEDNLVIMMAYEYTPLPLVEGYALRRMVTHLDPYI